MGPCYCWGGGEELQGVTFLFSVRKKFFKKFIHFWQCWVFIALHGLSLIATGGLLFVGV